MHIIAKKKCINNDIRFAIFSLLYRYLFRSGNPEHPSDRFYNTTVEVFSELSTSLNRNSNDITEDGYIVIGIVY